MAKVINWWWEKYVEHPTTKKEREDFMDMNPADRTEGHAPIYRPPETEELVKRLQEIVREDYAENNPLTGEVFEKNGQIIIDAVCCIEVLSDAYDKMEKERDELLTDIKIAFGNTNAAIDDYNEALGENKKLKEACNGYLGHAAGLRGENAKLRESLEWALNEIIREAVDVRNNEYNKACIALKTKEK